MQKTSKSQIRTIIKDTIIFEQKDSLYIHSNELKEMNAHVSEIKHDLNKHLNKEEDTFLGATYDTAFTVIFTLIIFISGILIDRWLKSKNEKAELKKLKDYFNNQFNDLKTNIVPELIKAYKKSYQDVISLDNGLPTSAPKILTNTYDRLANLESPLLFKTFKNSTDFNIAFSQIDFIKKLMNEIDEYHSISLNRSSALRINIAKLDTPYIGKLVEYIEIQRNTNIHHTNDPTFQLISGKISHYRQNIAGKRNLTKYYKEIIRPIQEHLVQTNLFRTDTTCNEIAEMGKQISHKFNELRLIFIEIRLQYRTFCQILDRTKTKLENINTE